MARAKLGAFSLLAAAAMVGQSTDLSKYAADLRQADSLLAQGDFAGVIESLRGWPERLPERPEARHFLGLAHYRLRDFKSAAEHLSAALERERKGSAAWRQTVEVLGAAYYFESRWSDAQPLLETAVGWRPDDSELVYTLAMSYMHSGRADHARIAFAKIFRVDPDAPQAFLLAAGLMVQEHLFDHAEALILDALDRQPDLPGADYELGTIAFRKGDYRRALELLLSELERNPRHAPAWHSLGEARLAIGQQAAAVEALKRAIWLDKRSFSSYLLLARTYFDQGALELANDTVRRAIEIRPRSYEANFLQGRIYYKQGDADLAKRQMSIAEAMRREAEQSTP